MVFLLLVYVHRIDYSILLRSEALFGEKFLISTEKVFIFRPTGEALTLFQDPSLSPSPSSYSTLHFMRLLLIVLRQLLIDLTDLEPHLI